MLADLIMADIMTVATISPALGLEYAVDFYEIGSEATQHVLDDMVRSDAESGPGDFGWQMSIPQMPG
jgi:hypothetical protein